jgi:hypothetical protein
MASSGQSGREMIQVVRDVHGTVVETDNNDTIAAAASIDFKLLADLSTEPFDAHKFIGELIANARSD